MFIPVLIKRLIIYIPLIIFSKNGSIIKYGVFDPAVIISIEKEVQDGTLTRDEADARYSKFLKSNINRLENKETVINSHFKKVGVDNLDQLRNEMLDENIPVEKIEATLGGMLRIIKAMKKKGNEYENDYGANPLDFDMISEQLSSEVQSYKVEDNESQS